MTHTEYPAPATHVRTGAQVTLLGRSALDENVVNYRDAAGREYAGFAEDYAVDDDTAERAEAAVAVDQDRPAYVVPVRNVTTVDTYPAEDMTVRTCTEDGRFTAHILYVGGWKAGEYRTDGGLARAIARHQS